MDWQVTAKTVYCEAVTDEVTVIVKSDWSVKCTGLVKYSKRGARSYNGKAEANKECSGIDCSHVTDYIQQLKTEEEVKSGRAGAKK